MKVPILANLTEFGSTPFFTTDELRDANVRIALYLLRRLSRDERGRSNFYEAMRRDGTQKAVVDTMQTRADLYEIIGYHAYEDKLDALFAQQEIPALPGECGDMSEDTSSTTPGTTRRLQTEEIRRALRRDGGQYRAVHGRQDRQRPALPRL